MRNSFWHFFFLAFSLAIKRIDGEYIVPTHLEEVAYRMQKYNRTSTVAPRFHLKSTIAEALIMWKLLRMEHFYNEWSYMSYTADLGAYHTKKIKRYIEALPELFDDYVRLTDAESILHYSYANREFYCEPEGVLAFKRGKHPNGMICDDILKDPQVKLDLSQLEKIERAFFEEVEQMPKDELHIVGTPQDQEDLFAKLETRNGYHCKRYDAIIDEVNKKALWEVNKRWDYNALMERRELIGDKAFNKEFRCMPVRGAEGFINLQSYMSLVNKRLKNYKLTDSIRLADRNIVAGFDIGKKTHPSHLAVFAERKGKLIQIHSKFMDGWEYKDQIDYCRQAVDYFKIDKMFYDNTRSEFELSYEMGELPSEMEGISFTAKSKFAMATELDKAVTNRLINFLPDDRQKRQILTVDCDLKAPETSDGHGDAFFSICLAVQAWREAQGVMVWNIN